MPVRGTVTAVVGSNHVLRLIAVCAFGDRAKKDFLVAIWSRRANGESIETVAVDGVCLTGGKLPLEYVPIVALVWCWYSGHDGGSCKEAEERKLHRYGYRVIQVSASLPWELEKEGCSGDREK